MDSRGLKYPSVTKVTGMLEDKSYYTDESRIRGNAVHAASAAHFQGLYMLPLTPEHQPYFDSLMRWADMVIDRVVLVEERLEDSKRGYTVKLDLVFVYRGDGNILTLGDLKTGKAAMRPWQLQVQTYRQLLYDVKGIQTHRGMSVRLKDDGSGVLLTEYARDYAADFNVFMGGLQFYRFNNPKKD